MTSTLHTLETSILARHSADPETSYVARLLAGGSALMARKLGEEAVETLVAALGEDRDALVSEAADLLFHLMVLLSAKGVALHDVEAELERREGVSGLVEKAARTN